MIQFFIDRIKNSIFFKIFMVLMVLSFGIWGIGDVITPTLDPTILIKADNVEVRAEELQRRLDVETRRLRESLGQSLPAPSIRSVLVNNIVGQMKQEVSLNVAAAEFGVTASLNLVRAQIEREGLFADESGKFSQLAFMRVLADNQLTEQGFIADVQSDMTQQLLTRSVAAGAKAPQAMVNQLFTFRDETRIADTLLVPSDGLVPPNPATDDDIKKTYEDNISSFTAPEYRNVEAVVLLGPDLVPADSISEDAIRAFYDEGSNRYRIKEQRRISQLLFETKEAAAAARALMAPGDGLMAIAGKAKVDPPVDLGERPVDDAVLAGFGEAINMPTGQISEPIESALGWHLIEVLGVVPEAVTPYEQVRDEIRGSLAQDKAFDALADTSVRLEDEIGSGNSLEDAAKAVGGRFVSIPATDRSGLDPSGVTIETIIEREKFLSAAFGAAQNIESPVLEVEGGYFIVKVTGITPPTPKPIETVRPEIAKLWERQTKLAEAGKIAEKAAADIGSGSYSAAAEADKRMSYGQLGPITRFGESRNLSYIIDSKRVSPDLLERLFMANVGDVVTAPVLNGHVIARLKEIVPARAEGESAAAPMQISGSVRMAMQQDLLAQFTRAAEDRYPVTVNQQVIDDLLAVRN